MEKFQSSRTDGALRRANQAPRGKKASPHGLDSIYAWSFSHAHNKDMVDTEVSYEVANKTSFISEIDGFCPHGYRVTVFLLFCLQILVDRAFATVELRFFFFKISFFFAKVILEVGTTSGTGEVERCCRGEGMRARKRRIRSGCRKRGTPSLSRARIRSRSTTFEFSMCSTLFAQLKH